MGRDAEVNIEEDGSMQFEVNDVSISTNAEIPSDWPSDAPIFPGSTATFSGTSNQNNENFAMLSLQTSASANDVIAYYESAVAAEGWEITGTANMNGIHMLSAEKDNRILSLQAISDGETTSITLGVGVNNQ